LPEVAAEADRLHAGGYDKAGRWDLGQVCDHLSYFIAGSLDGHPYHVPWPFKALFGRLALRRILGQKQMRAGMPTPQKPLPAPGCDEAAAVERLKHALRRLEAHEGELYPSPFFGYLTPQQWRELHLIHCAHHLGFLVPRTPEG
jgi:hypothetical protein